ncbi:class I fructose-bisphosphate aldolase [Pseudonocardia alni]|uniref:class I fructose-bisphosphate aldolase n=1 Tax=Pseudonocardia alni TaxID=33907 RepID=UPI0036B9F16A
MQPSAQDSLRSMASALVEHPRGIVALDARPYEAAGGGSEFEHLVATTPDLDEYVNGLVLPAASLHRRAEDGRPFPRLFEDVGILLGVRADTGSAALPGSPGEVVMAGTDGLVERMAGYASAGVRFVTCRSLTAVGDRTPSVWAVRSNAHLLARYARAAQDAGIVPVLHCGLPRDGDHSAERGAAALATTLTRLMGELNDAGVDLPAMVLSPGVAEPGRRSAQRIGPGGVAQLTLGVLQLVVPTAVAGVALHTGTRDRDGAVAVLAAVQEPAAPWPLTFCFGRSLISPAAQAWRGRTWLTYRAQAELSCGVERACAVLRPRRPQLRIAF